MSQQPGIFFLVIASVMCNYTSHEQEILPVSAPVNKAFHLTGEQIGEPNLSEFHILQQVESYMLKHRTRRNSLSQVLA